jgi:small neutral amino acid transporter SnatA (MarC family)
MYSIGALAPLATPLIQATAAIPSYVYDYGTYQNKNYILYIFTKIHSNLHQPL